MVSEDERSEEGMTEETRSTTLADRIERAGLIALVWAGAAGFSLWFVVQLGYWFLGWFA